MPKVQQLLHGRRFTVFLLSLKWKTESGTLTHTSRIHLSWERWLQRVSCICSFSPTPMLTLGYTHSHLHPQPSTAVQLKPQRPRWGQAPGDITYLTKQCWVCCTIRFLQLHFQRAAEMQHADSPSRSLWHSLFMVTDWFTSPKPLLAVSLKKYNAPPLPNHFTPQGAQSKNAVAQWVLTEVLFFTIHQCQMWVLKSCQEYKSKTTVVV